MMDKMKGKGKDGMSKAGLDGLADKAKKKVMKKKMEKKKHGGY